MSHRRAGADTLTTAAIRHIGPLAQDWERTFGPGGDTTRIDTVEMAGITFAGVQALEMRSTGHAARVEMLEVGAAAGVAGREEGSGEAGGAIVACRLAAQRRHGARVRSGCCTGLPFSILVRAPYPDRLMTGSHEHLPVVTIGPCPADYQGAR